jgi:hypothetical protein
MQGYLRDGGVTINYLIGILFTIFCHAQQILRDFILYGEKNFTMKTAELIKQLQDADPEGILEVVSGAEDTFYVECAPSYYDGNLFYVVRDPNIKGYNVKEAVISRAGYKVNIRTIGIREFSWRILIFL